MVSPEGATTTTTNTMTAGIRRRMLMSNNNITSSPPLRPPAQVYTRGNYGAVTTRPESRGDTYTSQQAGRGGGGGGGDGSVSTGTAASRSRTASPDSSRQHARASKKVIEDLNRAVTNPTRRVEAVTTACEAFDHNFEARHNAEMYHGAAAALSKLLVAAQGDDEVRMVLAALEMVFRGSCKTMLAIFPKLVHNFLPNLLRFLKKYEGAQKQHPHQQQQQQQQPQQPHHHIINIHAEVSLLNIARILFSISRCPELRSAMIRVDGMLSMLARSPEQDECRLIRVQLLANLAHCDDNKVLLYEQETMVETVLRIAHKDPDELARQHAAVVLREFSSAPANQASMGHDTSVLAAVTKMVLVEKLAATREAAVTVLQNLAFLKENRSVLATFKNGMVLEALKHTISSDTDVTSRRRAAGALANLVCDETSSLMGSHKGMLETLAVVSSKDENLEVQSRGALALTKIAGMITIDDPAHPALLDALVAASLSRASNAVTAVLRVKARHAQQRQVLARHAGIMDTLCDILVVGTPPSQQQQQQQQLPGNNNSSSNNHKPHDNNEVVVVDRDNSIRTILHLVNEDKNRKLLCNRTVLKALVASARAVDIRDAALRALERLATEVSNRAVMAHHEGLLVVVAEAVEREAEWERTGRDTEFGLLAKPLLMSLLVAM